MILAIRTLARALSLSEPEVSISYTGDTIIGISTGGTISLAGLTGRRTII